MFGPKELDLRNTYNPNLNDIQESAERTYGEANSFFRKEELYMKDIETRIVLGELSSEKDIYDECHAIASDLAKCCEMYLKALYIFENNIPGNQIDLIWNKLKNSEYKSDDKGNLIYKTSNGTITYAKYDDNGNLILDNNGKIIYVDDNGNIYNENNRGSKIKRNGHQLDRLIELLSSESRLLLETRMLTIPMGTTEKNSSVSILDLLQKKGIISTDQKITTEQYSGWLEQHKKTFEEARYSGQKNYDVNVEFMYHLTTQIKAVVQYKMDPKNNQMFTVTDEELSKLPSEIKQLVSFHPNLLSEELIKLITNNDEIKTKIINLFSQSYILPRNVSQKNFYNMINIMNQREIEYIGYICYMVENYEKLNMSVIQSEESEKTNIRKVFEIAGIFKALNISTNQIIGLCIQIKTTLGIKITNDFFATLFEVLQNNKLYNPNINTIDKKYYNNIKFDDYDIIYNKAHKF